MSASTIPWRKRSIDSDSPIENKRPKLYNYYRLKSESDADSAEDDTESVYSLQGKETDVVKDTSDTSTQSEYEVEIEYDIASLCDSSDLNSYSSSETDDENVIQDMMLAAAAVCDTELETAFVTDSEDSDNSRQDDVLTPPRDFRTCIKCKSQNDNPQLGFCEKCFQDRKTMFPPRPRRYRKPKRNKEKSHSPVKLDELKSCLSGLSSQDSGIGSSQEFASLCLDQIVVPQHLSTDIVKPSTSLPEDSNTRNRKRQISESSLSEDNEYELKAPTRPPRKQIKKDEDDKENGVLKEEIAKDKTNNNIKEPLPEYKEICIMCNTKPKNSVFVHGRYAHMCCCYKCAMRTWKSLKRCPICNRKVSNVIRVFTT